jgi:hypothetical protein
MIPWHETASAAWLQLAFASKFHSSDLFLSQYLIALQKGSLKVKVS